MVIASMLDFLTYTVCAPYSETTTGETFDLILELVAKRGRAFYKLFHSPSMTIIKGKSKDSFNYTWIGDCNYVS